MQLMEISLLDHNITIKNGSTKLGIALEDAKSLAQNDINLYPIISSSLDENLQIDWPGEYEAKQVLIKSVAEMVEGSEFRHFLFEVNGANVAYVANSGLKPAKEVLDLLSHADVLLVSSLLETTIAVDLIETIEPNEVIIIDLGNPERIQEILKEIARPELEASDKIVLKKAEIEEPVLNYHILSL